MRQNILQQLPQVIKQNKRSRIWQKIVRVMACIVVFCTTYALILPAITMTAPVHCGLEEHTHTQDCYVQTATVMVCQADSSADIVLHTHGSICYDAGGRLVCELSEHREHAHSGSCYETREVNPSIEGSSLSTPATEIHTHSDSCYESIRGELFCEIPVESTHTHGESCYGPSAEPTCGFAEAEAHTHGENCYEAVSSLVCQVSESEGHTHGESCRDAEGNLICTISESEGHAHSGSCYAEERRLICQKSEGEGHSHGDTCFGTVLTCTSSELTVHTHEDSCYALTRSLICGMEEGPLLSDTSSEPATPAETESVLVCTLEELYLHTHTDSCGDCGLPEVVRHNHDTSCFQTSDVSSAPDVSTLTCTLPESETHTHDFRCYGAWRLVCETQEHTHTEACASDPEADLETPADWEATFAHVELTGNWSEDVLLIAETQLGYTESKTNFTFFEDDPTLPRGYTRYGQWYGVPYGDWCGMFVSFCLNYAGVEEVPLNFGCRPWIEELSSEEIDLYRLAEEYTPNPGDIVFFDWDNDTLSDHVGLVYELIEPEADAAEDTPIQVRTIEGNSSNCVQSKTYTLGEDCLLGYGDLTAAQENYNLKREMRHTAEVTGADYTVTVTYSDMAGIPEGAVLVAEEILPEDERYQSFLDQVEAEESEAAQITYFRALDVHFSLGDQEIPLNAEVQVSVTFTEAEQEELNVAHFADDGTMDQPESTTELAETGDSTVSFNTDSFSGIVLYATSTADTKATTFHFTTVDPTNLETGKNYAIYTVSGDSYTFMFSDSNSMRALTLTGTTLNNDPINISEDGKIWTLTTDQMGTTDIADFTWCVEHQDDGTVRLALQGWDNPNTEAYPGPEYLRLDSNFATYNSTGGNRIALSIEKTATPDGIGNAACVIVNKKTGYNLVYSAGAWQSVVSDSSTATTVYFAEVTAECSHEYTYTASLPTDCSSTTATATRICSKCGDIQETDAANSISAIRSYASQLQSNNVKEDYSTGRFTWDTEGKDRSWTYYNGVMLDAFMKVGTDEMHDYVVEFYDDNLTADGTPVNEYKIGEVDSVPMALALFDLLGDGTSVQDQRYMNAIQYVYDQLAKQPVLGDEYGNNLLHKESWTDYRFGLDGIYMALPFLMEYANALEEGKLTNSNVSASTIYQTVYDRLNWVATTMYDSETGLYHHGWNGTNGNGVFWGRGIGWYAVALVDIIDMMPSSYRTQLISNLTKLFDGMLKYQDAETGMWYNVVNYDDSLADNKLETSVSAMMAYAMMKAYREDWVDAKYGEAGLRALDGIVANKMVNGTVTDTYKSSSVNTEPAKYTTSEYTTNEAKGVGALIMAAAPDHQWGEWTTSAVQTAAAEDEVTETRTCTVCGETQTRIITAAEIEKAVTGYTLTVVDPSNLQDGETYVIYTSPSNGSYSFMFSNNTRPTAVSVDTTVYHDGGYVDEPFTIDKTWYVPISYLGENADAFTWKVVKGHEQNTYTGTIWLEAQGLNATTTDGEDDPAYLAIRDSSHYRAETYYLSQDRPQYISLTVSALENTGANADCTIINNTRNRKLVYSENAWMVPGDTTVDASAVVFASVEPVYEEIPVSNARYQLTTVDPNKLQPDTDYVIYTKTGDDDETYTFLFADKNLSGSANYPSAVTVSNTGFSVNPVTVGKNWSLTEAQMRSSLADFTWQYEPQENGNVWLSANGYDDPNFDGPEYLCLHVVGSQVQTWYNGGTGEGINLNITNVNGAACNILRADDGSKYKLFFNPTDEQWEVQAENGTSTPIYFAAVTDTQAPEEEEPVEETYTFRVLGTDGPEEGKKYVIYYQMVNEDFTPTNDVKFLLSNAGCTNHGVDDAADAADTLHTAGQEWTLGESKLNDHSLEELEWTVVQTKDGWLLRSVSDPSLYLKLVCTDISGVSKVGATAYDEQGAQYFALSFTSSNDPTNSYYTATSDENANQLYFRQDSNKWCAVTEEFEPGVVNTSYFYFAEVIDDSTEDDTEIPDTEMKEQVVGYTFTTLDPKTLANLEDGATIDVAVYLQNSGDDDTYTFLESAHTPGAITVQDTGYTSEPITITQSWDVSLQKMGRNTATAFTWRVIKKDNKIWLEALGYKEGEYLRLNNSSLQTYNSGSSDIKLELANINDASCALVNTTSSASYYLSYDEATGSWKTATDNGTTIYFASVAPKTELVPVGTNFPTGVHTGDPTVNTLRFYNFVEAGGENIAALPGCRFVITGTNGYTYTIVSGDNPELHLPADIPAGTYTITEEYAPDGYMRDVNPTRSFEIAIDAAGNSSFTGNSSIGTFLNHATNLIKADKVGVVEDYNNRTYQIMLSAESDLRLYEMDPVDVLFVVDQSNSMLFPAGLQDTGLDVTLHTNSGATTITGKNTTNTDQLKQLLETDQLNKDTVYYIIADAQVSSTVYAIWYNGVDWMYQDASYYVKAQHNNEPGYQQAGELAVFPDDAAFSEQPSTNENGDKIKSNGGGLGYDLGNSALGVDIAAAGTDNGKSFDIYTSTNNYNRLHYLQDALAHAIHQLADANEENTVSLIRFTKETNHDQCIGPWKLNPANVQDLVDAVGRISTSGGTRQDIALKHTLLDHLQAADADHTYTVLITDGAPASSGSSDTLRLGTADDPIPTDEQINAAEEVTDPDVNAANGVTVYSSIKYYGQKVREKSKLMTIGLGMGSVDGGEEVLSEIASEPKAAYNMMLENAEQLMDALKQLLFSSMAPREKVDLMGDITDVISDSFYPIAYTAKGNGTNTGRQVLYSDDTHDWILLEPGDWITKEGEYVGKEPGTTGAGQLTKNSDGDFQITWDDQMIYDCELVWVPTLGEVPDDRIIVFREENLDGAYGRYWFSLKENEYVYEHGEYAGTTKTGNKTGTVDYNFVSDKVKGKPYNVAGQYVLEEGAERAHIVWGVDSNDDGIVSDYYDIDFDSSFQPYLWYGKFYVKAKEDFIGGNAIDTNKSASVILDDNDQVEEVHGTIHLETPTVNVRLLDLNQNNSEVTVFLGDQINADKNSPLDSLKYFFDNTYFTKLISDGGNVLNKITADSADDGLLENVFYLRYAMGSLTDEQWTTLAEEKPVTVEYTYDDASSHGPVGYFTFQLTKEGIYSDYAEHPATVTCEKQHVHENCTTPVETYTLHVTYKAYKLGEGSDAEHQRPTANDHNGTGSPGTEVGTGSTLPTGLGVVAKDNVHKVHVISGAVEVTKTVTGGVNSQDQTFTFTLHRTEDGTSETNDRTLTVTVKAGETSGTSTVSGLKRGTYVLTEHAVLGYQLQSITVVEGKTNCYAAETTTTANVPTATFHIGSDTDNVNVIGSVESQTDTFVKANSVDTLPTAPVYTGYTGTPDGVYGAAEVTNLMMTYELPESGGTGTTSYTLGGMLLILLAGSLFLVYNKERRKEDRTFS